MTRARRAGLGVGAVISGVLVAFLGAAPAAWAGTTPEGTQTDPVVVRLVAGQAEPALVLAGIALMFSVAAVVVVLSRPRAV